jgi:tRNA pseudouridine55 synthase
VSPPAASGLVIVDKPAGWTSHDVVARIRRLAGTRRAGHAGTLDPMATGVLVVGVEKATRLLGHLSLTAKGYQATIRLGQATDTDDADGEVISEHPASGLDESRIRAAAAALTGTLSQVPPAVSAVRVGGRRAYRLAREGTPAALSARTVTVSALTITAIRPAGALTDLDADVECSSGTYIRSIARDLGAALGTGGHLTALRRTHVGPYGLNQAATLDELAASWRLVPLAAAAAAAFARLDLTKDQARLVAHGGRLPASVLAAAGPSPGAARTAPDARAPADPDGDGGAGRPVAAFAPDGTLVALLTERDGAARPLAVFAG